MYLDEKKQYYLTLIVLFCISLFLTAYSKKNPNFSNNNIISRFVAPALTFSGGIVKTTESMIRDLAIDRESQKQNSELRKQLDAVAPLIATNIELEIENQRLRRLLDMKNKRSLAGVVGEVISLDISPWSESALIDVGSADGVTLHAPVMNEAGLVGQVVNVSTHTSRILYLIDSSSGLDAMIQRTRVSGILRGQGANKPCSLLYLTNEADVKPDDIIISSGLDGRFPKGMYIGKVASVERDTRGLNAKISVTTGVNFPQLETVWILTSN